jgi:hypothetical protein
MPFGMRRAIAALPALVALAVAPAALAKGPTSTTITGPGLREPLRFAASSQSRQTARYWHLVDGLGFFPSAFGQHPSSPSRPRGELGPKYAIRYGVPMGGSKTYVIVQDLYPYAAGGPVTYMPPGQKIFDRNTAGGWYRTGSDVKAALVQRGLPASRPAADSGSGHRDAAAFGGALLVGLLGALGVAALRRRPRPTVA